MYYELYEWSPALVERRYGDGLIAMLTTTIDRDWTSCHSRRAFFRWYSSRFYTWGIGSLPESLGTS